MFTSGDTARETIRKSIIENADGDQMTVVPAENFGDICIIGEQHKEAAEYFKEKIAGCKTKGDEIRLHFKIEERFSVALRNLQHG